MANDCLVTKLKSYVNNDNLPKLGVITLIRDKYTSNYRSYNALQLKASVADPVVSLVGASNTVFSTADNSATNPVDHFTVQTEVTTKYVYSPANEANIKVEITNKYDLTRFVIGSDFYTDLNNLEYNALECLGTTGEDNSQNPMPRGSSNAKNTGDFATIFKSSKNTLKYVYVNKCTLLNGSIEDFKDFPYLEHLCVEGCNFGGEVLTFVAGQVAARTAAGVATAGIIKFSSNIPGIKLNGHAASVWTDSIDNGSIEWNADGSKCIVKSAQSSVKKISCYGYTTEEIETLTAAGGDWEGYTVTNCN